MKRVLPKSMYRYFWDSDPSQIDVDSKSAYIISRVLQWGRAEDLRWLKQVYGEEALRVVVKRSRELSPKHGTFYSLIYNIPRGEIACLQTGFHQTRSGVWNH